MCRRELLINIAGLVATVAWRAGLGNFYRKKIVGGSSRCAICFFCFCRLLHLQNCLKKTMFFMVGLAGAHPYLQWKK